MDVYQARLFPPCHVLNCSDLFHALLKASNGTLVHQMRIPWATVRAGAIKHERDDALQTRQQVFEIQKGRK